MNILEIPFKMNVPAKHFITFWLQSVKPIGKLTCV